MAGIARAGLIGGGVIGAGWAARFVLNGIDAAVYDPDPEIGRKLDEVLGNARRAYRNWGRLPEREGRLTIAGSAEEAAAGADFVQESLPERIELKQKVLAGVSRATEATVIASSTSGLLPSDIQRDMERPERLVVGHPFNPVYLLPLVEVVPGRRTAPETVERASAIYAGIGMDPLPIDKEIDGFIADRLMEALWREALHLINDGVATADQIDRAITGGCGIRWSFMGTFMTYRIAGGEAGMRHFMAQFGPSLKWPWSKLVAPELTDDLLDRIVEQSDEQAARHPHGGSIRDLERWRDDKIVAVLKAVRD